MELEIKDHNNTLQEIKYLFIKFLLILKHNINVIQLLYFNISNHIVDKLQIKRKYS